MATLTRRGSGTPTTTGTVWTTVTNAVDGTPPANPATYAVWTSSTSGAVASCTVANYDFSAIPAGATINSVTTTLRHFENNITRIATVTVVTTTSAGANIGTNFACTRSLTARDDSYNPPVTLAQLQAGIKTQTTATRAAVTQSATFNVDHIDVTVDYTPLAPTTGTATVAHAWAPAAAGTAPVVTTPGVRVLESSVGRELENAIARLLEDFVAAPPEEGSATTSWTVTSSAAGKRIPEGAATTVHAWVPAASGVTPAIVVKQGTATVGWSMAAGGALDILMEPFNDFTTNGWVLTGTPTIVTGRTGTAANMTGATNRADYNLGANESEYLTVGFAFQVSSIAATRTILSLRSDAGSTSHNLILVGTTGAITVTRGGSNLAISAGSLVAINTWNYLEVQIRLSDTNGTIVVRLNGTQIATAGPTADTKNAGTKTVYDQIRIGPAAASVTFLYDDLYLRVDAAAAFRGDIAIPPAVAESGGGAVGKRTPKGAAVTGHNWAPTATGRRTPSATATVGHSWALAAQGVRPAVGVKQGSGLAFHTWTPTAAGKRTPKGSRTLVVTWVPTAAGRRIQAGTATTGHTWTTVAAGKRIPKGAVTVAHLWVPSAAGLAPTEIELVCWFNDQETVAMQWGDTPILAWQLDGVGAGVG